MTLSIVSSRAARQFATTVGSLPTVAHQGQLTSSFGRFLPIKFSSRSDLGCCDRQGPDFNKVTLYFRSWWSLCRSENERTMWIMFDVAIGSTRSPFELQKPFAFSEPINWAACTNRQSANRIVQAILMARKRSNKLKFMS